MAFHATKSKGVVKWLNHKQGFGFIESEGSGAEVLLQFSELTGDLLHTISEGDRVEFDSDEMTKGLRAKNARKLNLTEAAE